MTTPWKHPNGTFYLRERVPSDIAVTAKGREATLSLEGEQRSVRLGEFVKLSLETKEPAVAKDRYRGVSAEVQELWKRFRQEKADGPIKLTYLPMRRGFLYLVAIMDWFTRKVLAGRISNTLEAEFCLEALNEAIHKFGPPEIMNTDQGSQFTSFDWTDRLKRAKTKISMDGKARYLDNIFIERLWRSLKYESLYLHAWETGSQAKAGVGRWITFYNHQRPHAAHGGQPPAVVYFNATQTDQQVQAVA